VLDGETQALIRVADEIACGVGPGVEIGATPEGLAKVAAGAFGHVVDEDDGEVVAAVEFAQEPEETGDIGCAVLIEAMKADEGIEDEELGLEGLEGVVQGDPVALEIEAEAGCGNDVEVEAGERHPPVLTELGDAVTELGKGVLGEVDHGGSGGVDLEAAEAGGT
jgi:hypothetical protein